MIGYGPHLLSRCPLSASSYPAQAIAPRPKVGPGATVGDMGNGSPYHPPQDFHGIPAHQRGWEEVLDHKAQWPKSSPGAALSRTEVRSAEGLGHFAQIAPSREAIRAFSVGGRVALSEGTR